ncbi:hypothetical protein M430DRAFT_53504 [Amorphotheca resinae ATCC 22711]|uniref:Cytochrome P450 monooxygenase n=1 Tax=Amorphotheca resinae ATCC 22711 TaxID=857342 RepID=A0A2T3ATZ4_AMORE|nr:hypothetical protein M430DRAFT_53504 [Amorphotheca resinae ATCC 22711]PSS10965.1 hypothetical protein M430DRAFT_53504 [Amorphotheca resinae ATCC 22711]
MAVLEFIGDQLLRPNRAVVFGLGAIAGLAMHHGFYIHGEWHVQAPAIVVGHSLAFAALFIGSVSSSFAGGTLTLESKFVFRYPGFAILGYLVALFTSITVYRLFFNRLARAGFAGPVGARITKLWHMWACRGSKNHLVLDRLHRKYGDFVRTGPTEVTVFHPDVYWVIDGPKAECVKSEWYDILDPNLSLVTARNKFLHQTRRRQWNQGFTTKSIAQYEEKILKYVDQLDVCIEQDVAAHRVSDVRNLFFWFGFDAMGDFVFNKPFNMLQDQKWHHIIVLLQRALSLLGPFSAVPWLIQIGFKLMPRVWILKDWFDMVAWCEKQMHERLQVPEDKLRVPDVAHYLMEDAKTNNFRKESMMWLNGDSLLAIVAGSEPTASVLLGIFCELARNPAHARKIYDEIQGLDIRDARSLSRAPHLEAVISEALRFYPVLPTGGNRKTLEHGVTIGGTYIPPYTTIVAPRYSIMRREDCFERGNEFLPERWFEKPEMIRNKAAYAPFGTGHHSCLGRVLATDDMRLVTARLVSKYHIRFPTGEDGHGVLGDLRDQFTANPGQLHLVFELREKQ